MWTVAGLAQRSHLCMVGILPTITVLLPSAILTVRGRVSRNAAGGAAEPRSDAARGGSKHIQKHFVGVILNETHRLIHLPRRLVAFIHREHDMSRRLRAQRMKGTREQPASQ